MWYPSPIPARATHLASAFRPSLVGGAGTARASEEAPGGDTSADGATAGKLDVARAPTASPRAACAVVAGHRTLIDDPDRNTFAPEGAAVRTDSLAPLGRAGSEVPSAIGVIR